MSDGAVPPAIEISNHQEMAVDLELLVEVANKALPLCIARAAEGGGVLLNLDEVEVSIVSDEAIAAVHAEFLDDPTPTDVITFDHGEILVSAETAAARAPEFGHSIDRELALYVVHGLLHLAGHGDKSEGEFERMRQMQEEVLTSVW